MIKFKKLIAFLLVVIATFSLFTFAGCNNASTPQNPPNQTTGDKEHDEYIELIGGVSETFTGAVSSASYSDETKAATAFVENEVAGTKDVEIVETVSKGTLSQEKINALGIPEADKTGIVSVEEIEVEYKEKTTSQTVNSPFAYKGTLDNSKKIKVYVIKYPNDFRYYAPCPVNGDTLNKSYYDSVFDVEKYKNCTYDITMTMDMTLVMPGEEAVDINQILTQKLAIAENAILLEEHITGTTMGYDIDTTLSLYLVNDGNGMTCYMSFDGETWIPTDLVTIGFGDYEELTPFYDQYLDYTYFKKTAYGFELSNENAQQYVKETFKNLGENLGDYASMLENVDFDIDMFVKYYVNNGVLTGMREDATVSISKSSGMTMDYVIVCEATVSKYGTTVVEQPFEDAE